MFKKSNIVSKVLSYLEIKWINYFTTSSDKWILICFVRFIESKILHSLILISWLRVGHKRHDINIFLKIILGLFYNYNRFVTRNFYYTPYLIFKL